MIHAYETGLIKNRAGHKMIIEQLDPINKNLIKMWKSFAETYNYLGINERKMREILKTGEIYKNFIWKKYKVISLPNEEWKKIENFDNYLISNFGRIKNIKEEMLSPKKNVYLNIELTNMGIKKYFCIHKLVGMAFIENPLNYPMVNHKDANKYNNHVDNLEWLDYAGNSQHAVKIGKIKTKKIIQYDLNNNIIKIWMSCTEASKSLDISRISIWYVLKGKAKSTGGFKWKYLFDYKSYF